VRSFITVNLLDIVRAVSRNVWRRRHYATDVTRVHAIYSVGAQTNHIDH